MTIPLISRRTHLRCLLASSWLAVSGCASWNPLKDDKSPLKAPRLAPDVAVIEYRYCELPTDTASSEIATWSGVDELSIDASVRRRLAANGLRCGVCSPELPQWLQSLAQRPTKSLNELATEASNSFIFEKNHTLQCRAGEPNRIMLTSSARPEMTVLVRDGDAISGTTYRDAQGILEMKAFPLGDRRVRLELVPEIEHGDPRQQWRGQDGVFVLNSSRERRRFESLRFNVVLSAGQVLVVGCNGEPMGLGATLFTNRADDLVKQRLLLLRFSKSALDELFYTEEDRVPLVDD